MNEYKTWTKQKILACLEYAFVILFLIEYPTFFVQESRRARGTDDVIKIVVVLLITILVLKILTGNIGLKEWITQLSVLVPVELYLLIYFFAQVRGKAINIGTEREYVIRFCIILALLIANLIYDRLNGEHFEILYKISNVFCVYSVVNILLFMIIMINHGVLKSDSLVRYMGDARIPGSNFYNVVVLITSDSFKVGNLFFLRDYGCYTEPGFISVIIAVCLCTELFLRNSKKSVVQSIIYTVLVLCTGSSMGMIWVLLAWGLYLCLSNKISLKYKIVVLACVCALTGAIIANKGRNSVTGGTTGTYVMHMGDYKYGLEAFVDHPLAGFGYGNIYKLEDYLPEARSLTSTAATNSLIYIAATGGLFWGGFCAIPFIIGALYLFYKGRRRIACCYIVYFAILAMANIHYRIVFLMMCALALSLLHIELTEKVKSVFPHIALLDIGNSDVTEEKNILNIKEYIKSHRKLAITASITTALMLVIVNTSFFWNMVHDYYLSHELYISDSHWNFPILVVELCVVLVLIREDVCELLKKNEIKIHLIKIVTVVISIILYEVTYYRVNTILKSYAKDIDSVEFIVGLGLFAYFIILICMSMGVLEIIRAKGNKNVLIRNTILVIITSIIVIGANCTNTQTNNKDMNIEMGQFDHEAIFEFRFDEKEYKPNEPLCSIRILLYDEPTFVIDSRRIYGSDLDNSNNCNLDFIYKNDFSSNDVIYDIIPEDGVVFSIKASSGYDELKNLYISKYNYLNQPIDRAYYNADGTPAIQTGGYAAIKSVYNMKGMVLSRKHYDVNGKKMLLNGSYFEYKRQYDERGNVIREELYDTDGNLVRQKTGYAITEMEYDNKDNKISVKYYDENNEPIMYDNSYHEVRYEYNSAKKIVKTCFYGIDGEQILNKNQVAIITNDYDDWGNTIREEYFDTKGNIKESRARYSGFEKEYNDKKQIICERYMDTKGGVYGDIIRYEYDENGRLFRKKYYGIDNGNEIPTLHGGQYAADEMYYDRFGRMIREEYYGIEGELSATSSNYAVIQNEYNDYGQKVRVSYYDENRNPVGVNGYQYSEKYYYNDKGQVGRVEYYGADDVKLALESGQFAEEREYDDRGNITKRVYYGVNEQRVRLNAGYSELHSEYNDEGRVISESYYATDGRPCNNLYGYAMKTMEYDVNGNKIREVYTDTEGKFAYVMNTLYSEATSTNTYNEIRFMYDDKNRIIKYEYMDKGKRVATSSGYSAVAYEYSDDGNEKITTYLDENDEKFLVTDLYSSVKNTFDIYNRNIKNEYFDSSMKPVKMPGGQAVELLEYDKIGYGASNITYCDENLKPILYYGDYSSVHRTYNDSKKIITEEYFDDKGIRTNRQAGYSYYVNEYDDRGNLISISYYDDKSELYNIDGNYCVELRRYDVENKLISKKYINSNGEEYKAE